MTNNKKEIVDELEKKNENKEFGVEILENQLLLVTHELDQERTKLKNAGELLSEILLLIGFQPKLYSSEGSNTETQIKEELAKKLIQEQELHTRTIALLNEQKEKLKTEKELSETMSKRMKEILQSQTLTQQLLNAERESSLKTQELISKLFEENRQLKIQLNLTKQSPRPYQKLRRLSTVVSGGLGAFNQDNNESSTLRQSSLVSLSQEQNIAKKKLSRTLSKVCNQENTANEPNLSQSQRVSFSRSWNGSDDFSSAKNKVQFAELRDSSENHSTGSLDQSEVIPSSFSTLEDSMKDKNSSNTSQLAKNSITSENKLPIKSFSSVSLSNSNSGDSIPRISVIKEPSKSEYPSFPSYSVFDDVISSEPKEKENNSSNGSKEKNNGNLQTNNQNLENISFDSSSIEFVPLKKDSSVPISNSNSQSHLKEEEINIKQASTQTEIQIIEIKPLDPSSIKSSKSELSKKETNSPIIIPNYTTTIPIFNRSSYQANSFPEEVNNKPKTEEIYKNFGSSSISPHFPTPSSRNAKSNIKINSSVITSQEIHKILMEKQKEAKRIHVQNIEDEKKLFEEANQLNKLRPLKQQNNTSSK